MPIPTADPSGRLRTIVVVDDEAACVKLIAATLARRYRVHGALTVTEARETLQRVTPDLLILDVRLGDDDGLDLLAEVRRTSGVPVLLITGFGDESVAARALDLGVTGYLRKPFDLGGLRTKIDTLLAEGPQVESLAERARSVIDRIAAEPVTAAELAERLEAKPEHLMAAFREQNGRTPMQYLRAVRLARAQELLRTTSLPVSDIAARVGFREISYFDRSFKRQYGIAPLEFRKSRGASEAS
jgi:YesN/AraC family two-component response regulator